MTRKRTKRIPSLPPRRGRLPVVAILGRPNVGKSTLFNRLVGRQASIVEDRPGVTRDRLYADTDVMGRPFTLVDMGGFESRPDEGLAEGVSRQCKTGLDEAALVIFLVDGRTPPTSGDEETAELLRRSGKPCVMAVNKVDGERQEAEAADAFSLGLEPMVMVSALHGRGISDLEYLIYERLPESEPQPDDEEEDGAIRVAIVGRPNAGKSSLVNRFLGEDRLLTDAAPGTTRDPVDSLLEQDGARYVLVDTAGIRRKRSVPADGAEKMSVTAAVRAMERCHVAVLLLDAEAGIAEQDARVLGLAVDRGRAVVVAFNKWDLVQRDQAAAAKLREQRKDLLAFAPWARVVQVSALTGAGLPGLLTRVREAYAEFDKRIPTGALNRLFAEITENHPPPLRKGKPVKLMYATQASVRPPTFVVHATYPEALHFSYRRYVSNRIREVFGFEGTPIRLFFNKRRRRGDAEE
ncbi:MAG: ribosome biogenesis GTPase Der [Deltaproteobacteria bacterium]|nr:ribosome biogenesis GTPase Der [Deltaproteobacteria bacterium]